MVAFHKVLFPVDFSPSGTGITRYVAAIVRKFDSELVLLHTFNAFDRLSYATASPTAFSAAYDDTVRQERAAELELFGVKEFEGLKVTRIIETGDEAHRIAAYADHNGIDLIIMPTHGYGKFRRLLLGSVTSKVLHDTHRPVLTTAHSETLGPGHFEDIRTIVCAVDPYSDAGHAIRAAADVAEAYDASVRLVHAVPFPDMERGALDVQFQQVLFNMASELIGILQRTEGTDFEISVRRGRVEAVIAEEAQACNAQMVVIGRGKAQEFLGRLRTNTAAIIRESPCPVLSV